METLGLSGTPGTSMSRYSGVLVVTLLRGPRCHVTPGSSLSRYSGDLVVTLLRGPRRHVTPGFSLSRYSGVLVVTLLRGPRCHVTPGSSLSRYSGDLVVTLLRGPRCGGGPPIRCLTIGPFAQAVRLLRALGPGALFAYPWTPRRSSLSAGQLLGSLSLHTPLGGKRVPCGICVLLVGGVRRYRKYVGFGLWSCSGITFVLFGARFSSRIFVFSWPGFPVSFFF